MDSVTSREPRWRGSRGLFGLRGAVDAPWTDPEPIRAELLSIERLEQYAHTLAVEQPLSGSRRHRRGMAARIHQNTRALRRDYESISHTASTRRSFTPAAEWFVDNYHVVERQLQLIRDDLPASYYRQLPRLASGPLAGFPRITGIAWAFVAHTDSHFDAQMLTRFVEAYQRVEALDIGELWALASMLRVILIENLRRSADRIVGGRAQREAADQLADRLLGSPTRRPEPAAAVFAVFTDGKMPRTLAVQLVQRLRDCDPDVTPAVHWLEESLHAEGLTPDVIVTEELQRQSAANVTVRNIVTSLVQLSALDWADVVEELSVVDRMLAAQSDFADMDFSTRNRYRSAVEEIARYSGRRETDVARRALEAARHPLPDTQARRDPGYYLVGSGRPGLERLLGYRPSLRLAIERGIVAAGIDGYVAMVVALTAAVVVAAALVLSPVPTPQLVVLLALIVLPASESVIALLNSAFTRLIKPESLAALDLAGVVPAEFRTVVAIPILLASVMDVEEAIANLESRYLASARGELYFTLLADGADADAAVLPEDAELIAAGRRGIDVLNRRYGRASAGARFLWLHRSRRWNAAQGCWMGWERKRGKLHELNRLLRGARDTSFDLEAEEYTALPAHVRNVLVLDADTQLPHGAAEKLVAKLAHPLNRPVIDPASGRVTEGHGILQPRVTPTLPDSANPSLVQLVLSGTPGLDPYAFAVSDVYQDLCGEGSFTGKGLYDIDAFEAALAGRIAENTVLSHDLLEGIFARAGVASDVEVVEPSPDRYDVVLSREHRWARGDWQLLPWVFGTPRVGVSMLGRWKLVDNLRRTLVPPVTLGALAVGWTLPMPIAAWWTALVVAGIGLPALLPIFIVFKDRPGHLRRASERRALAHDLRLACLRWVLGLALLADRAWWMCDAIVRTLVRLTVTRRHLLDWTTAAQAQRASRLDLRSYARRMVGGIALAAVLGLFVIVTTPGSFWLALPWLVMWLLAPLLARQISVPQGVAVETTLTPVDALELRLIARRTWRFFETFVTAEDHFLPPDNFQETPAPVVARRTSPTNIGVYLLSATSAYEFGWTGLVDWLERLEATMGVLARLERFRGHFFNWYDTGSAQPLLPTYVSTVDSGNLAGHLIALANALESALTRPLWGAERLTGIRDALLLDAPGSARAAPPAQRFADAIATTAGATRDVPGWLRELAPVAREVGVRAAVVPGDTDWVAVAAACALSHARDIRALLPGTEDAALTLVGLARQEGPGQSADAAQALVGRLTVLAATARRLAYDMEFAFLLKPDRMLLSIGFIVAESRLDGSDYDLLASEARLASFVAIAKRDVPARHWFRLGRRSVAMGSGTALLSWSGSMFEYLMPSLVMAAPSGSLLERALRLAVRCQRDYGAQHRVPWGVSESAYNVRDLEQTYQYSPFGVPALGLKRGLGNDLVISPYSTGLAAMVDPTAAAANFRALRDAGALGHFGYYEALDFTPERLAEGERVAVVRAYMAHHQGMTIVSIANALLGGLMRNHFHGEASARATELLLQEKPPRSVDDLPPSIELAAREARLPVLAGTRRRRLHTWCPRTPHVQLLSNGRYAVMLNAAGAGSSRWGDLAVSRWKEDPTADDGGQMIFLRDCADGTVWSTGFQPTAARPDSYRVTFTEDRAEIVRRDGDFLTAMQVLVSAEHDAEARRVSISNRSDRTRDVEVTSYLEVVLATAAADRSHRAFSNLFVETEYEAGLEAVLAGRRARAPGERGAWAAHLAVVEGETVGAGEYETDRERFIGRGLSIARPRALEGATRLTGSTGTVLDPVFSLRRRLRIPPGGTARVTFWTAVAETREQVLQVADKCRDAAAFDRASTLAWTRARVQLHHLGLDPEEASLFQRLAAHIFYWNPALRPGGDTLRRNHAGAYALWAHGISGDLPIVAVQIDDATHVGLVREVMRAHEYLALKNLAVDIVILNQSMTSYVQDLQSSVESLARASQLRLQQGAHAGNGGVYALRAEAMSAESRLAVLAAARVVLVSRRGSLVEQLDRLEDPSPVAERPLARRTARPYPETEFVAPPLELFNGTGGFTPEGREYVVVLRPGMTTPMPWINVIGQPEFGFQVSASGSGFTWSLNSQQNALTSWSNDAVCDPASEAFFIRDDDSGELWSPTAAPMRDPEGTYVARHGQGYSRFEYASRGIAAALVQFVPRGGAVKVSRLTLTNSGAKARQLSVAAYAEWALGTSRVTAAPFIVTEVCPETGALLARNPWNSQFGSRVAFLDMGAAQSTGTCDRREFLGPDGRLDAPAALRSTATLTLRAGAGLDPCAALLTSLTLAPGESHDVIVLLGQAPSAVAAIAAVRGARQLDVDAALAEVTGSWDRLLGRIKVTTPDPSFDILLNRWLLYQTVSCRVWARAAFYQSSGAYGFRDQLQDCMALTTVAPDITRAHLLRASGRQFLEGDVQHWWMADTGKGIRTRISDDRVWLAYCVAQYLTATGDAGVLDESVPYLAGEPIPEGATDSYFEPGVADTSGTVYEHCVRALETSLAVGSHGLPLMGTGDWNDGMNLVGAAGRGESVWLGWFLCATLSAFAPIASARGDDTRARRWLEHREALRAALENAGWDGDWYRRGYFDDGTPLGSAANAECRIDSIAQSWAVLSGAANPARAAHAMAAVNEHLVRPREKQVLLFTPPFSNAEPNPGYVRAYPGGVRENGGQYTHGSIWSLMAFAALGDGDRAKQLFDYFSPIHHSTDAEALARYKLEPYAVAADVYAAPATPGRGGWSWYTGSAGWLYRAGLESILGFRVMGDSLILNPCIPRHWRRFDIEYRHGATLYRILVTNPFGATSGVSHVELDHLTILRPPIRIALVDDGAEHSVRVVMG